MQICNKCFIEKPDDAFYKVNNAGKITLRKICKQCHINRELNRYNTKVGKIDKIIKQKVRLAFCTECQEWKDKSQHFAFETIRCNSCIKKEIDNKKEIKAILEAQIKKVEEEPQIELEEEITPLELETEPLYRVCDTCGLEKLKSEYYKSNKTHCISCLLVKRKNLSIAQADGTQWAVLQKVGTYQCDEQFEALSDMMVKIGWVYEPNGTNDYDGTWHKPGFKDKDGNFKFIKAYNCKPKQKRSLSSKAGKCKLDGKYEEIKKLREEGHLYKEIAGMLNCSHTLLRTFVRKHKLLQKL